MNILGLNINFDKPQSHPLAVSNAIQKKAKSVFDEMQLMQLDRAKQEIKDWRNAITSWESVQNPDRQYMIRLYNEIELDDMVKAKVETICNRISGSDFEIITGDKADPDKTAFFKAEWLHKFVKYFVESEMCGFSLVEVGGVFDPIKGYNPNDIKLIPRQYVQPDRGFVRRQMGDQNGINFFEPPYNSIVLAIGDPDAKGLFCTIAPMYIYKKNALQLWANFQRKFGIPPVVAKTDLTDEVRKKDLAQFLKNMDTNPFLIADINDVIETLQGTSVDGFQTFKNSIELLNEGISIALEGQTMTTKSGSSLSQSEVHERVGEIWHMARLRRLEGWVNNVLMPKLITDGAPVSEGDIFRFIKRNDTATIADNLLKLSQAGYKATPEWVTQQTGIPVEAVQATTPTNGVNAANAKLGFDFFA